MFHHKVNLCASAKNGFIMIYNIEATPFKEISFSAESSSICLSGCRSKGFPELFNYIRISQTKNTSSQVGFPLT